MLTRAQYDNTVEDLFGDATKPASSFPPENEVQGFTNNTTAHQATPLGVEKYLEAAEGVAARAVATRLASLAPCAPGQDAAGCGRAFVRNVGLQVFRRPLSTTEAQMFDDLFARTSARAGYTAGVELVLQAMLQSPQFLYRIDTLRAPSVESGAVALGAYELAARLSFFLNASTPDAALLKAAETSQLYTEAEVEAQARRLLSLPRARGMVRDFHHQWLGLQALGSISRQATDVNLTGNELASDWQQSLNAFVDHVFWETGNVTDFFTSKRVYLSPQLAPLYGVTAPAAWTSTELPDRSGLLTQPAILALLAHPEQSAPVLRGVFVRERLLCQPVPPPPPTADVTAPDPNPMATTRERFRVHTEQPACSSCHSLIDGIGFGLEGYDQLGRFRTLEQGLPVDTSGEVLATGDMAIEGPFNGAASLSARLASSKLVRDCMATNWYRYALGRIEGANDACSLDEVKTKFSQHNGNLHELLIGITKTLAFRYRAALPQENP